jgi:hypothetical protein
MLASFEAEVSMTSSSPPWCIEEYFFLLLLSSSGLESERAEGLSLGNPLISSSIQAQIGTEVLPRFNQFSSPEADLILALRCLPTSPTRVRMSFVVGGTDARR